MKIQDRMHTTKFNATNHDPRLVQLAAIREMLAIQIELTCVGLLADDRVDHARVKKMHDEFRAASDHAGSFLDAYYDELEASAK